MADSEMMDDGQERDPATRGFRQARENAWNRLAAAWHAAAPSS